MTVAPDASTSRVISSVSMCGKARKAAGAGSLQIVRTGRPSARSAAAIAITEPSESPSGRA